MQRNARRQEKRSEPYLHTVLVKRAVGSEYRIWQRSSTSHISAPL
jgi:hypothetical protein